MVQWLRICLPVQGTQVQSQVREDPTCHEATKSVCQSYWGQRPRACALRQKKPQREARLPQLESRPQCTHTHTHTHTQACSTKFDSEISSWTLKVFSLNKKNISSSNHWKDPETWANSVSMSACCAQTQTVIFKYHFSLKESWAP